MLLFNRSPWMLRKPDDPPAPPAVEPPPTEPPAEPPAPPKSEDPAVDKLLDLIKSDPERAAKEIKDLRKEAADKRERLKAFEDKEKAAQDKQLTEQGEFKTLAENRAQEIEDLKKARKDDAIRTAVLLAAARAEIADPEDALKLADLSKVVVDGLNVTGATEVVAALIAAKPYLVKSTLSPAPAEPPTPRVTPTNPGGGPQMTAADLKKLTTQQIADMPPDELAAILAQK
jgi:hypothetical protein